jgi:prephenate dehydratase
MSQPTPSFAPALLDPAGTFAFLGPEGTFAHAALLTIPGAAQTTALPLATVTLAIDAVRDGRADGALVPIESSIEGAVPATLDELAHGEPLVIAREAYLPVVFSVFVRPGTALTDIRSVATHTHAEAQCRRWLMTNLPNATLSLVGSTAGGAVAVSKGQADAAVAPAVAGRLYGLETLATDIADNNGAVTRFVLLTRPGPPLAPTGNDKTSLVANLRTDHAGALLEMLTELALRGVNMTRIESRPTRSQIGTYSFSIDCEGHIADARVGDALSALRRICASVRYVGSYPRVDGTQDPIPLGRTDADFADGAAWVAQLRATGVN